MPYFINTTIKTIETQKQRQNYVTPGTMCEISLTLPHSFDP